MAVFSEFPSPLTGIGPAALGPLTRQVVMPVLTKTWRQDAGQVLPQQIRQHITSRHIDEGSQP